VKQTVIVTPTNHTELFVFYKATMEVLWLQTMEGIIMKQREIKVLDKPTVIYENNVSRVRQMQAKKISER
jgi:hypothetical protein